MGQVYLVRYGLMRHVGRFRAESDGYCRGQTVVVHSPRGTELGEILASEESARNPGPDRSTVLRLADSWDFERAERASLDRPNRLAACERVFRDGVWPLELIDVEPLLDERRTVLHYLGPHHLDDSGLLQVLRESCDLDVFLEPVGVDEPAEADESHGCGDCGSGGCGMGGCGTSAEGHGSGCSSCAVKDLVGRKRAAVVH